PATAPTTSAVAKAGSWKDAPLATDKSPAGLPILSRSHGSVRAGTRGPYEAQISFFDRTILAGLDKPEERKAFLERKYDAGNVNRDKRGLYVVANGKKLRADSDFLSTVASDAPELSLGTAGAIGGSALGGPLGGIAGAGVGAAAGKGVKEATKSVTG